MLVVGSKSWRFPYNWLLIIGVFSGGGVVGYVLVSWVFGFICGVFLGLVAGFSKNRCHFVFF
jgi:hypothetical protein